MISADPATSAGSSVGLNADTTVGPGETISYTWHIPDLDNAEGAYVFNSLGNTREQQASSLSSSIRGSGSSSLSRTSNVSSPISW